MLNQLSRKTLSYVFDLNGSRLSRRRCFNLHGSAMDNKEPEGQLARSEIYFIEVLPPEGNATDDGAGKGEMADTKEIPIRDFINKTKTIIRSTYDAIMEEEETSSEKLSLGISSSALSVKYDDQGVRRK